MDLYKFKTEKTAFYASLGELNANCANVYFVLHGYGQLAKNFIKHFEGLAETSDCIIAPEGLSKFYLKGLYGEVGASWMSKEERAEEIEDYINYLNSLLKHLMKQCSLSTRVHVIGFSQGAATASRWVDNGFVVPASLTLWSGAFAHDLSISFDRRLSNTKVFTVCGNQDKIYPPQMMKEQVQTLKEKGFNPKEIYFDGRHGIERSPLKALFKHIRSSAE